MKVSIDIGSCLNTYIFEGNVQINFLSEIGLSIVVAIDVVHCISLNDQVRSGSGCYSDLTDMWFAVLLHDHDVGSPYIV